MATPGVTILYCKELKNLPLNHKFLLRFKLNGAYDKYGGTMHLVSLSCSNSSVILTTKKVMVEKGWEFLTNIKSSKKGTAVVKIKVNGELKRNITFNFLDHSDVFYKGNLTKMINEMEYIKRQLKSDQNPSPHQEYLHNYCMQAAERGLSEIMGNDSDFYAVERDTHKHKNKIGFSGKNAFDRGSAFKKKGFVSDSHILPQAFFKINHKEKNLIYNSKNNDDAEKNYEKVRYSIISMSTSNKTKILNIFEKDIQKKELGIHFYYFTVTNGFHTLLLVIDTITDACKPAYEIWDQHARSSSHGPLSEIGEGIRRQTSWTFANSCLNRYKKGNTKQWDSVLAQLWKIKLK